MLHPSDENEEAASILDLQKSLLLNPSAPTDGDARLSTADHLTAEHRFVHSGSAETRAELHMNVSLACRLAGDEICKEFVTVLQDETLVRLTVRLQFSTASQWSAPSDLILGVVDPNGRKFVVLASPGIPHWPSHWYVGDNGTYSATFLLQESGELLAGAGRWSVGLRNSYSLSGAVSYSFTGSFAFVHTPQAVLAPSPAPAPYSAPTLIPSSAFKNYHATPVFTTLLGVQRVGKSVVRQDRVQLPSFTASGMCIAFSIVQ